MRSLVLLLDCSASMDEIVGDKRKIDHLRDAVVVFPEAKLYGFSNNFFEIREGVPEPMSSTAMRHAFRQIASYVDSSTRLILISDGLPTDGSDEEVIAQAKLLPCPVNVLYIGDDEKGERFMKELARATGGQEITLSPQELQVDLGTALTDGIQKLALPPARRNDGK
ncbi:hypothetical protein DRN34_05585 [Thermococci archaeon]|nr:MAG: hypothetical protein DRN34_05585 [Thermococci archaeon]